MMMMMMMIIIIQWIVAVCFIETIEIVQQFSSVYLYDLTWMCCSVRSLALRVNGARSAQQQP